MAVGTIISGGTALLSAGNQLFGGPVNETIGSSNADLAQFQEDLDIRRASQQQEEQAKTIAVGLAGLSLVGLIVIVGGD